MAGGSGAIIKQRRSATDAYSEMMQDVRMQRIVDGRAKGHSLRALALIWDRDNPPAASTILRTLRKHDALRAKCVHLDVEKIVRDELHGYDEMQLQAWLVAERAKGPQPGNDRTKDWVYDGELVLKAMETIAKIKAGKARLLGLNAPERLSVEHQVDGLGAWIEKVRSGSTVEIPGELIADSPLALLAQHNGNGHAAPSASGIPDALVEEDPEPAPPEPVQ